MRVTHVQRPSVAFAAAVAVLALAAAATASATATATFTQGPAATPNLSSGGDEQRPPRRHDYKLTLKRPYYFNGTLPFWDSFGKTIYSENNIRLAASVSGFKGSVWAKEANKHPEWEVEFSFSVWGRGTVGGDGLAFWYTKERAQEGPVFGSKDKWEGLGVFFDTSDERIKRNTPLVSGVINDGSAEFVSSRDINRLGNCLREYRNSLWPVWVRVTYYDKHLAVDIDNARQGKSYISCFATKNITLPTGYYFGVSAMSGKLADDHDILSFETYEVNPKASSQHPLRPHEKEKLDQGKKFSITEETKKHIEDVEHKMEEVRHKEEEKLLPHVDMAALSRNMQETQFRVMESLDAIHDKLEHIGTPANEVPANIDSRLDNLHTVVTSLSQQVKKLVDTVQALTLRVRDQTAAGNAEESAQMISQVQQSMQDIQTKFAILENRDTARQADSNGFNFSSVLPYVLAFFGLQTAVLWCLGRRKKPDAPKKFI